MIGDAPARARSGLERISTGVAELDAILHGGFPRGSLNIVMGHPGTGKTVFAQQLVFHNAGAERPILYLTTLSEPLSKVVTYLQGFAFYDEDRLLDRVVYEDIRAELTEQGPQALVDRMRAAIREQGPAIIVVDSFKAIHDLVESSVHMRRFVSELSGVLSAYDATVFLLGEYGEDQVMLCPEFAVADGIIEFARRGSTKRDDRFLRVLKLRGSAYAEGLHAFAITSQGLRVFPRLVTPESPQPSRTTKERLRTGIEGLDRLLGGGLWRGSTSLVTGQAGSGKTTLALQFTVEGVRSGEPSLFLNFQENPSQLARTIGALGVDLDAMREAGLHFQYASPVELSIDRIVVDLFEVVRREGVRRVVVDALGDLLLASSDRQRFRDFLYALCQQLTAGGVTALFTLEAHTNRGAPLDQDEARFASMVDALVELDVRMAGDPQRTLRVVKARGIAHDLRFHEITIESGGVHIREPIGAP
jgi:circadian clock protein KaiC